VTGWAERKSRARRPRGSSRLLERFRSVVAASLLGCSTLFACSTPTPVTSGTKPSENWEATIDEADAQYEAGHYDDALQLAREAERIARTQQPLDERLALSLLSKARPLKVLRRTDEALAALQEALDVCIAVHGEAASATGIVLNAISDLHFTESRFALAAQYLEGATNIARKSGDQAHLATLLGNQAWLQINLYDYKKARTAVEGAIELLQQLGNERDLAHQYRTLGVVLAATREPAEAERVLLGALALDERYFGEATLATAAGHCQLAGILSSTGRVEKALEHYDDCLRIREAVVSARDPRFGIIAETIENVAGLYSARGDHASAISLYQRALRIRRQMFGPESIDAARASVLLASAYYEANDAKRALFTLAPASAILRQHDVSGRVLQDAQMLTVKILLATNDPEYLAKAKALAEQLAAQQSAAGLPPARIQTLQFLGAICLKLNDRRCALSAFNTMLESHRATFGEPHQRVANAHISLGAAWYWFNDFKRAREQFDAGFDQWRRISGTAADSPFSIETTNTYIDTLWRTQTEGAERSTAQAASFRAAQLSARSEAARALAQLSARVAAGSDQLSELVRTSQDLDAARSHLESQYANVLAASADVDRAQKLENLRAQVNKVRSARESATRRLARSLPAYRALAQPEVLEPRQVQRLLAPGELLVAFNFGPHATFAWGISREQVVWKKLAVSRKQVAETVTALRRGLDVNASPAGARGVTLKSAAQGLRFDRTLAHDLYRQLLGPFEQSLARANRLLFVPDGPLESLPPSVLVTEPPPSGPANFRDYRETAWLIRDHPVTILPSISSLASLQKVSGEQPGASKPFLGVGDPLVERFVDTRGCADSPQRSQALALAELHPLGNTRPELLEISRTLGGGPRNVLFGARATESSVRAANLKAFRVLSFATHGLVPGEVPELDEPALVLTPDRACSPQSGLLTASEVSQLQLRAQWVILSACNTASSDGKPSSRGLSGLARAFFYAGAQAVLVSHWSVADSAAMALTTTTFAELGSTPEGDKAKALQHAMLRVMNDPRRPEAAHPAYWAPFVLVGR